MDRLDSMRLFVAILDAGGFAPAARRLGVSPAAATRAIRALEARLGAPLLVRTSRVVQPTDAGLAFGLTCRRLLAELDDAEAVVGGAAREVAGHLVITAPQVFGRLHVAPVLLDFLDRQPAVTARLVLVDRVTRLVEEGIDVAVRIGPLPDSALIARKVGVVARVVVAAPDYLRRAGTPAEPDDLADHAVIAFTGDPGELRWRFEATTVPLRPRLIVDSAEVAVAAAVAGRGITRVLSYQAAADLAAGRLLRLLPGHEPGPLPVQLVHVEQRLLAARVRAFLDHAVHALPARIPG